MTIAVRPSLRLLALVPVLLAASSVVLDLVLLEFFGLFLLADVSLLVYVGVGLLLALRLPRHPVGWLLLLAGTLFQLTFAANGYAWAAFIRWPGTLPLGVVALFTGYLWLPALGSLFLAIMLFPTGRPPSPRWRLPAAVVVLATAFSLVANWLTTPEFPVSPTAGSGYQGVLLTVANPIVIEGPLATAAGNVSPFGFLVYFIPIAATFVRFRTAAGTERQQLKWFAYAVVVLALLFVSTIVGPLFSYLGEFGALVWVVAIDLIPVSVAIAILRYRLYDIDLLINRTLVYGVTSAAIAVTFFLGLIGLQAALRPLTSGSELAVAASTLISFALFQPIRRRVRDAVDRRFDRRRYDAERTLDAFAARLREQVDLAALEGELLAAVHQTVQPAHASVWLRQATR